MEISSEENTLNETENMVSQAYQDWNKIAKNTLETALKVDELFKTKLYTRWIDESLKDEKAQLNETTSRYCAKIHAKTKRAQIQYFKEPNKRTLDLLLKALKETIQDCQSLQLQYDTLLDKLLECIETKSNAA